MKSKLDQQIEDTFYYAVNFYSTNDRSIAMQEFCLSQMMLYGLDRDTCIRIQNPIMSVFQMGELMQIGSEITQQHLATITHNIRQHLLSIQPKMQPEVVQELPNIQTLGNVGQGSNKRDIDGVSVQVKNIVQDVTINGYQGQKSLIMSNYDLEPHDTNYLSATMPSNTYNFTLVDFSHNSRIEALGLDYLLKGAAGISSIQQGNQNISLMYQGMLTRPSFNIVKLNLENCNIGDIGADIIGHALANGKLPATKHIDVSENNFTLSGEKFIVNALQQEIVQDILVTLKRSYNIKTMISGNKEQKQFLIRETLQVAQDNGVDVKNVAVSKSVYDKIVNFGKIAGNFTWGFGKCNIVPEDTKTFAAERIIAKASKKVFGANNAKDAVVCFFDTIDEVLTSNEGVQLIKNLDLFGANSVIDSIE